MIINVNSNENDYQLQEETGLTMLKFYYKKCHYDLFIFLFFKTDGPIFLDNNPAAFSSARSGRSLIDSKSK